MARRLELAVFYGFAAVWLAGCTKPCDTTADCNAGEVCAAAICRTLLCEEAMFATEPKTKACVALSGCFLTEAQRTWQTCQSDPCLGLSESGCLADARCQPGYATPDVETSAMSMSGRMPVGTFVACRDPEGSPNGLTGPGVNNGDQLKHGGFSNGCLQGASMRKYAGCTAVLQVAPELTPQKPCHLVNWYTSCPTRTDCTVKTDWNPTAGTFFSCVELHPRLTTDCNPSWAEVQPRPSTDCNSSDKLSCLINPDCQTVGTRCYCPPGGTCDCSGGDFLGCESNDRLRRCSSSADCNSSERCDNDEACIPPRTFAAVPTKPAGPGAPGCLGACVPAGCAGMGEQECNADPACDAGSYNSVCHRQQYYSSDSAPRCSIETAAGDGTGRACSCGSEFAGCAAQSPILDIRPERSLLVRDPEILDDPTFSLQSVLTQLAPVGQVDAFVQSLLSQIGQSGQVASGATTKTRQGFARLYPQLNVDAPQLAQRFSAMMATTALINRLDLATTKDCGEARISFAMTSAYTDRNQRMTLIVELKVPDDGNGCQTVAQRWTALSRIDDVAQRRTQLIALYNELLKPANLGQLRTNEFVNRTGTEPWELREFHLRPADGLLDMMPVAQTVDPMQLRSVALLQWLRANAPSLLVGTAIIPAQFLAGASTEDGGRLNLATVTSDPVILAVDKAVNGLSCAGCHLTETKSPFVHIGERLATKVGSAYRPAGRAVIDNFLQKELVKRTTLLKSVLAGSSGLVALDWRPVVQTRVH